MAKVAIAKLSPEREIAAGLHNILNALSWRELVPQNSRVVIKPNLCQTRLDPGAVTNPLLVGELVKLLKEQTPHVAVGESDLQRFPCEMALQGTGLDKILAKEDVQFINFSKDEGITVELNGLALDSITFARTLVEADVFISMPVLKTHKLTTVTMGMKNQFGCIPRSDRLVYHPHINEVLVDINAFLKPTLIVMDGLVGMEADGPITGVPVRMNTLLASDNVVSLDATACRMIGINPYDVRHLQLAEETGLGSINEKAIKLSGHTIPEVFKKFQPPSNDVINRAERWIMKYPLLSKIGYTSFLFPAIKWMAWRIRDLSGYSKRYKNQMETFYTLDTEVTQQPPTEPIPEQS